MFSHFPKPEYKFSFSHVTESNSRLPHHSSADPSDERVFILNACSRSTPVAQSAPRNLLTRWDESSIPANGIFSLKTKKNKKKMPNGWRTINSLVHKIRLHGRRGKGMAESFSRQKSRHAPQKEGGLKILCDLPPV